MGYICIDRGTERCPCCLMEAGQCYTCGFIKHERCDCTPGWQGVCPYNEYVQNGCRAVAAAVTRKLRILQKEEYGENLRVFTLSASPGFALKCSQLGAFLMVEAGGYKLPVSVMRTSTAGEPCVRLAVYIAGPKTRMLDSLATENSLLCVTGPYYSGMINAESFDREKASLVMARGIAMMALLNQKNLIGEGSFSMFLDTVKLPDAFLQKYAAHLEYEKIDLEHAFAASVQKFKLAHERCIGRYGRKPNMIIAVSPYYEKLLTEACGFADGEAISANHANMCCGEGVCGACSHTDKNGETVRGCKCTTNCLK